jgi:hypothetical protein
MAWLPLVGSEKKARDLWVGSSSVRFSSEQLTSFEWAKPSQVFELVGLASRAELTRELRQINQHIE